MLVERALSVQRHEPENAQMGVGQGRLPPGSGIGISTEIASGSACGASSGLNSRKPTTASRPTTD
jgi:hypothetical protein